jgi:general secretion pathway protein C
MGQYLSWLTNSVLFVLCCYLVADTANEVFAALLTPTAEDATRRPTSTARARRDWADREIILKRNLFNASLLAPAAPVEEPIEDLEATRLPLNLLGTAASTPTELSWAAVEDEEARQTVIVRMSDQIHKATVQRIERRRIVLSENGVLRELTLDDDEEKETALLPPKRRGRDRARPARRTARAPAPTRPRAARDRVEKLAKDRFQMEREDVDDMMRNPSNLFSQARILPKYEEGEMVGLQINAIKPGSFFEEVGIQSGDVITRLNDTAIDSPEESAKILVELSQAESFTVDVERGDGTTDTLEFNLEE